MYTYALACTHTHVHTSTCVVTATGALSGTTSPSNEHIAVMVVESALNFTLCMPAKSFFKCDWITLGFVL